MTPKSTEFPKKKKKINKNKKKQPTNQSTMTMYWTLILAPVCWREVS